MKLIKHLFFVFALVALVCSCKNENKEASTTSTANQAGETTERSGQAFISDDEGTPNCLQIAIGSPDHKTLVAAVQAAQVENALVNVGPLTVFAPTDAAFAALPEGTVENLVKPENKATLSDILKYHVTPGNLSTSILTKLPKLGQANNQDVQIEVIDGKPVIGGANIIASVKAGNGIVHVIDKVLLPPAKDK
ncbi:fasciclin domain-containing protein [Flavobacteriaceae bacterium S0825]|uniref:fasciclin domain-containing protein n=1 Tax=Gaetbulibacter sp. S0825 TaxID=2720084 RepID=UPI00142F4C59|nr:fasciclin domain-containing protein [Gaetbulibacter sp. S0825]MCK0108432.1 fasciclin domain-containing protein [Flavobacteriaceae bacterium S0825]NIX64068.1 fasciclin domain-containing protein [Gaetbulibacter sp. S0825]